MIDLIKAKELAEAGDFDALKEGGAVEVFDEIVEGVQLVVRMDFKLMRKAYASLLEVSISEGGTKTDLDIIGAGDKVLQFGAVIGGEEVSKIARARLIACQKLGAWVVGITTGSDDVEAKKK